MPKKKLTHVDLFSGILPGDSLCLHNGLDSRLSYFVKMMSIARKTYKKGLGGMLPTPDASDRRGPGSK